MAKSAGTRVAWATATYTCQNCSKVVTRSDKPGMIYGAFLKLKFCGYDCAREASRADHVARFWRYVDKSEGCWVWTGSLSDKGYGVHHANGRKIYAHRYSLELHRGPLGKLHALHSCDNPRCVNPDHLRPGTHQENMRDAAERKRFSPPKGQAHRWAKLTEAQASEVLSSRETGKALAARFGVAPTTIYAIRNGQNWKALQNAAA